MFQTGLTCSLKTLSYFPKMRQSLISVYTCWMSATKRFHMNCLKYCFITITSTYPAIVRPDVTFQCLNCYSGLRVRHSCSIAIQFVAAGSPAHSGSSPADFLDAFIPGTKVCNSYGLCFDDLPEGPCPEHLPKSEPVLRKLPDWIIW